MRVKASRPFVNTCDWLCLALIASVLLTVSFSTIEVKSNELFHTKGSGC